MSEPTTIPGQPPEVLLLLERLREHMEREWVLAVRGPIPDRDYERELRERR